MGLPLQLRARSKRPKAGLRALLGRAPDAAEVGERLARLARRTLKGKVTDATAKRVTASLHPHAGPLRIVVLPDGDLEIQADVATVGPGYHAEVLARIAPLLEELEFTLDGEPAEPKQVALDWLVGELRAGATRIGMPADRVFKLDASLGPIGPIQTALGPRSEAWRDAVLAEPARGADAFPWWSRGPGREALSRGLLGMWFDVAWREPLDADERGVMEGVDEELAAARKANPDLPLPYAAWAELLDWLGADDAHAHEIRKLVETNPGPELPIGYRRHLLEIELAGGWTMDLGGAFVGKWEDEGSRWWATDGDRVVELTTLTADGETDSQRLLDVAAPLHPVVERIEEAHRRGRAEVYDEDNVHFIHGLVACAPHVAILTCKGRASDEAWALETWRSLRNPAG